MNIILMVGLPGSGKSYYVDKFLNKKYTILCLDDIRLAMGSVFNPDMEPFAKAVIDTMGKACMYRGQNIVIDSTNVNHFIVDKWIKLAERFDYNVRIIVLSTSFSDCMERNQKRKTKRVPIEKMNEFHQQYKELLSMNITNVEYAVTDGKEEVQWEKEGDYVKMQVPSM